MSRRPIIRVGAAVLGGLAVAVALLGALTIVNAGQGFEGCTATTALGWTIPLLAGGLVGLASWILLSDRASDDPKRELHARACGVCGHQVLDEWRLCPYCGTLTEQALRMPRPSDRPVVE